MNVFDKKYIALANIDFNCYANDELIAGAVKVKIPDIKNKTIDVRGNGLGGSFKANAFGQIESAQITIECEGNNADFIKFFDNKEVTFDLLAVDDCINKETRDHEFLSQKIHVQGFQIEMNMPEVERGEKPMTTVVIELTHFEYKIGDKQVMLFDKINGDYTVNDIEYGKIIKKMITK